MVSVAVAQSFHNVTVNLGKEVIVGHESLRGVEVAQMVYRSPIKRFDPEIFFRQFTRKTSGHETGKCEPPYPVLLRTRG